MAGQLLGHDEINITPAEGGDKEDSVGVEVEEAISGGVF